MVEIVFEAHSTTLDNESRLASGWFDVGLSELGKRQAKELGERYKDEVFDAVFCSDLQRSYKTAETAFVDRDFKIVRDPRLRECNYGNLTRYPSEEVESVKTQHINKPFPGGESYNQVRERVGKFLVEVLMDYDDRKVMIIGHRATQYSLENIINSVSLCDAISKPFKWQPGWKYNLKDIQQP
jgi:broad specificity phosphatase PhoE